MFIEYKIKFQKDGLTITECIEPGSTAPQVKEGTPVAQNALLASFQASKAAASTSGQGGAPNAPPKGGGPNEPPKGGGPNEPPKGGGAAADGAPITLIGPFIFLDGEGHHGK